MNNQQNFNTTNNLLKVRSARKQANYFLSHSVGLPFEGAKEYFEQQFFCQWQQQLEPWPMWLQGVEVFRKQLAELINSDIASICPQSNLSSALTKILYSLPAPSSSKNIILYSAEDFPSMAFVLQKAQQLGYQLHVIPKEKDLTNISQWQPYLTNNIAICLITHVQSNNGRQLPVQSVVDICRQKDIISIVDVAQSIGLLTIDSRKWQADFIIGSCVKWLCGGPGAGFLWVNDRILAQCHPVDVGWFSHENPFEFNSDHFEYHQSALKFWGGTPSVAPFIIAAYALKQINTLTTKAIRKINIQHLSKLQLTLGQYDENALQSPLNQSQCSGTLIVRVANQPKLIEQLKQANIAFDSRSQGIRLSPHFYTTPAEIDYLCQQFIKFFQYE